MAYGPEAIVLVLVAAGTSALRLTLPVTVAIAGLLTVLVVSYSQVITGPPSAGDVLRASTDVVICTIPYRLTTR